MDLNLSAVRLVALDLDDTTLDNKSTLAPGTRAAIERCIHAGITVTLATGRSFSSLPEALLEIPGIPYAVTSNGATVCALPEGRCLWGRYMPPEAVEKLLTLLPRNPAPGMEVIWDGAAYAWEGQFADPTAWGVSPRFVKYFRATRKPVPDINAFIRAHETELEGSNLRCHSREMELALRAAIRETLPELYMTSSFGGLVELANREAGKASGLRFVAGALGLGPEAVAAFGNADNDVDMLRWAGLGVAVANASPLCLAAADAITATNQNLGVAKFLHRICDAKG